MYKEESPHYDPAILKLGVPVLGICYGAQLITYMAGGVIESAPVSEYGPVELHVEQSVLFEDIPSNSSCYMSHTDYISKPPAGYTVTAHTADCPCAAMEDRTHGIYAVQFHPEVTHTEYGKQILRNFLFRVCGCKGDWIMSDFVARSIAEYREKIGDRKVLCAMSGGVDSSVAAVLLHKAIGKNLTCILSITASCEK